MPAHLHETTVLGSTRKAPLACGPWHARAYARARCLLSSVTLIVHDDACVSRNRGGKLWLSRTGLQTGQCVMHIRRPGLLPLRPFSSPSPSSHCPQRTTQKEKKSHEKGGKEESHTCTKTHAYIRDFHMTRTEGRRNQLDLAGYRFAPPVYTWGPGPLLSSLTITIRFCWSAASIELTVEKVGYPLHEVLLLGLREGSHHGFVRGQLWWPGGPV
jgi:hypothetical protein